MASKAATLAAKNAVSCAIVVASENFRKALEAHQTACHDEAKARDALSIATRAKNHADYLLSEARLAVLRAAAGEA